MGKRKAENAKASAGKRGRTMKQIDYRKAGLRKHATLVKNAVGDPCRGILVRLVMLLLVW